MKKVFTKISAVVLTMSLISGLAACSGSSGSGTDVSVKGAANGSSDIVISVAHSLTENTPEHQNLLKFKETIENKTNGAMTVQLYPNGSLGGDATSIEGVQNGNIIMTFASTATEASYVPECEVFDIPFLFTNKEEGRAVMADQEFHDCLDQKFQDVGLKLVGATAVGFRWLTCNKAVNDLEDLKGLKIRTMENPNHITLWNDLGANATPISGSELFTSLQQGTVDGQENPVSNIYNTKLYEVNHYMMDTRHILNVAGWIVNKNWYESLSDENRAIFDEAMEACISGINADADAGEEEQITSMEKDKGMHVIYLDDATRQQMRERTTEVEKNVRTNVGDELVDSLLKAIGR